MNRLESISAPTADGMYRRQARRIRAVHRHDPVKMQQALKNLIAARIPSQQIIEQRPQTAAKIDWSTSAILGHRTPAARAFADRVAEKLMCGVLPYSARRALMGDAARNSIAPFEASLIIAAVQNRLHDKSKPPARLFSPQVHGGRTRVGAVFSSRLAMFLAIEAAIVITIWHLLL